MGFSSLNGEVDTLIVERMMVLCFGVDFLLHVKLQSHWTDDDDLVPQRC